MRDGTGGQQLGQIEIAPSFGCYVVKPPDQRTQFALGRPARATVFREYRVTEVLACIEQLADFGKYIGPIKALTCFC